MTESSSREELQALFREGLALVNAHSWYTGELDTEEDRSDAAKWIDAFAMSWDEFFARVQSALTAIDPFEASEIGVLRHVPPSPLANDLKRLAESLGSEPSTRYRQAFNELDMYLGKLRDYYTGLPSEQSATRQPRQRGRTGPDRDKKAHWDDLCDQVQNLVTVGSKTIKQAAEDVARGYKVNPSTLERNFRRRRSANRQR